MTLALLIAVPFAVIGGGLGTWALLTTALNAAIHEVER